MRYRFGNRHAIALETRREHKHVGGQIQFDDALRRHGTEYRDPVAETVGSDIGIELRGGGRIARTVTSNRQPPGHVGKRGKRRNQQVVTFDRHYRADREEPNEAVIAAKRARNGIITWAHNVNALRWDVVVSNHDACGRLTRDHDTRGGGERDALGLAENVRLCDIKAWVQSERLVHQRNEWRAGSESSCLG